MTHLSMAFCRALAEVMHYDMCTLVQAQSIPAVLGGKDHVVKAKTGTGKTLAFLIPAIERVSYTTICWPQHIVDLPLMQALLHMFKRWRGKSTVAALPV